jgi:hypothetical protein
VLPRINVTVDGVSYVDQVGPRLILVRYLWESVGEIGTPIGCDTGRRPVILALAWRLNKVPHPVGGRFVFGEFRLAGARICPVAVPDGVLLTGGS